MHGWRREKYRRNLLIFLYEHILKPCLENCIVVIRNIAHRELSNMDVDFRAYSAQKIWVGVGDGKNENVIDVWNFVHQVLPKNDGDSIRMLFSLS